MPVQTYRHNQTQEVVDAIVVMEDTVDEAAAWCGGLAIEEIDALDSSITYPAVNVPTAEGNKRCPRGYEILKHQDGSFSILPGFAFNTHFRLI